MLTHAANQNLVIPAKAGTHLSSWFNVGDCGGMGPRFRGDDDFVRGMMQGTSI
jgi:hypothetical protein